jgi:hypothetical protein
MDVVAVQFSAAGIVSWTPTRNVVVHGVRSPSPRDYVVGFYPGLLNTDLSAPVQNQLRYDYIAGRLASTTTEPTVTFDLQIPVSAGKTIFVYCSGAGTVFIYFSWNVSWIEPRGIAMAFGLSGIFSFIHNLLGPVGQLFDKIGQAYTHLTNVFSSAQKLVTSITDEVNAWRNFKQDIRFAQRVVNLESAINKTRDLIEGIPNAYRSIVDAVKQIKSQIGGTGSPTAEAESAVEDLEAGGFKTLFERFPALARGFERVLGGIAILVQALEAIVSVIDDIQTVVDEIKRLRLEIEKLDTIFLQQGNKRKTLFLANGKKIKIRLGKLHKAS